MGAEWGDDRAGHPRTIDSLLLGAVIIGTLVLVLLLVWPRPATWRFPVPVQGCVTYQGGQGIACAGGPTITTVPVYVQAR